MSFTARAGRAVISLGVDGAAASKKDIDGVANSLKKVDESTFQKLTGQMSSIQSSIGGLKSTFTSLAQLTVAGFGAGAFVGMIKGSIDAADNLNDLSKTTGVTLANLAGLKLAAQQSGGDLEGIADSISKLSVAMGKDAERFAKLGVTAKDPLEAFEQLADVFAAIEDPQMRAALGAAALEDSWKSAAPLLSEGGDKIRMLVDRGSELSGMTQEMADRADEFNDSMAEMATAVQGAKNKVAADMLPALTQITTAMTDAYVETGLLSAALIGLGGVMAHAFTDEFASAEVKLRNLKGELDVLKYYQLSAKETVPVIGWLLWGSEGAWDAEIASKQKDIDNLLANTAAQQAAAQAKAVADRAAAEAKAAGDKAAAEKAAAFLKGEAAAKAAAATAMRQQEAYTTLTNSIRGRVAETERELAGLAPLNEAEKLQIDLTERLIGGKLKLSPVQKALYEQGVDELDANLKLIESQKVINRVREDSAKLLGDRQEAASKTIDDAVEEAEKNEELARTFGLTKGAIAELEVARLEGQLAQHSSIAVTEKEIETLETLEKLIGAKKRSAGALGSLDAQEAVKQANKAMLDEWKTSVGKYDDVFRTGFADMLNNGKDGWKSFTTSLVTTFKTSVADQIYKMFAQPFVMKLVASLIGVTGGATLSTVANAATGGSSDGGSILGALSGAKSAYSAISMGFEGIATTVADTVQAAMYQSGMTTQIASNGAVASGAGAVAGYAAGAAVGVYGGRALSNGYSVAGGSGNTAVNVGTIAGAIIGGPIGAAIGGLIGGAANHLFGHKEKEITGTTLNGSFGANGFSGTADSTWIKKGGLFRSDKDGVDSPDIDAETAKQFTAGYDALKTASADFASVLGINADAIKTRSQSLSIALTKDEAANKAAIASFFVGVGDTIARELLPTLSEFAKEGEGASATLQRLATNYATIDAALTAVGMSIDSVGVGSLAARERLVTLTGGIDALVAGAAGFGQNYLTEQERLAPVLKSVTEQMAALGYAGVDTNAEFKNLVLGLRLTEEADAQLYAKLMKLQGAFAMVHPAVQAVTGAVEDQAVAMREAAAATMRTAASGLLGNVDAAYSVMQRVAQGSIDVLNKRIAKERELSTAIKSTLDSMVMPGSEMEDRARAQAQIRSALSDAKSGQLPDAGMLSKSLSVLSQDASSMFSTYEEYARDFYTTQNDIAALGTVADNALSVDEKSLLAIEEMLLGVQAEIDILKGIDTNGLTLIQAVEGVRAAILAAQQNALVGSAAAINGAYKSALGRAPDNGGMQFFQDQVANGTSIDAVVNAIKNSPEAKAQGLYQSLLGRTGDAAGIAYWSKALGGGMSVDSAKDLFRQSNEYKAIFGIRGFEAGGDHSGGLRIVGENGPELEITGPSRIMNNADLMARLRSPDANSAALVEELRAQRQENRELRQMLESHLYAIAKNTMTVADIQEKQEAIGLPPARLDGAPV